MGERVVEMKGNGEGAGGKKDKLGKVSIVELEEMSSNQEKKGMKIEKENRVLSQKKCRR